MSRNLSYLELHIHSVDGHVTAFAQTEAEAIQKLLEQIQPGRLFTQPYLAVSGRRSLTVIPAATIVRVDLVMESYPDWAFHFGIRDAMELDEEEFRQRIADAPDASDSSAGLQSVYAEIETTNGERLYLEIEMPARQETMMQADFGMLFPHVLSSPSLYARRLGGGALLINPAHILRVQFHPAPPYSLPNAWNAEPLTERGRIA